MQIINPSTPTKPVMPKLQNLFVALINMDSFQMTLKFSFSLLTTSVIFDETLFVYADMQNVCKCI